MRLSLFLLIAIPGASFGQSSVEWGRPVVYADFGGRPDKADTAAANISVTILLGYAKTADGNLRFRVTAVMDKDESWIREEFKTKEVLVHEQGHFDIAHIFAKKLEATLRTRRYTAREVPMLNDLYDTYLGQMNTLQLKYDKETRGGSDVREQARWRRFIQEQILSMQDQ